MFDAGGNGLESTVAAMNPGSGFVCAQPVRYNFQSEMFVRACGVCRRCQARTKRDISGRAAAEAAEAAEVVVFTLTYGKDECGRDLPGAREFITADRQKFLKRLRAWLRDETRRALGAPKRMPKGAAAHVKAYWNHRIAEAEPKVRYLGCGERGKRGTLRCHWHIVAFGSKPLGLESTRKARDPKSGRWEPVRQKHPLWQLGFCVVDVLPKHDMGQKMKAVRYCTKYVTKSRSVPLRERRRGVPAEAMFFRSTATPLGHEYLTDWARRTAQAGLPTDGEYMVPGVTNSRGKLRHVKGAPGHEYMTAPRQSRFKVQGRMRDHFIAAYRAEWERLRPDAPLPRSDWLARHDPEWVEPLARVPRARRITPGARAACEHGPSGVVKLGDAVKPGVLIVRNGRGKAVGLVRVDASGFAAFLAADGSGLQDASVRDGSLRDLAGLSERQHVQIERWIAAARGPGWRDPRDLRAEERDRMASQRAAVERFAKESPNIEPMAHLPPVRAMTALRRKLLLHGNAYMPGVVVRDGVNPALSVRAASGLRKPIARRTP